MTCEPAGMTTTHNLLVTLLLVACGITIDCVSADTDLLNSGQNDKTRMQARLALNLACLVVGARFCPLSEDMTCKPAGMTDYGPLEARATGEWRSRGGATLGEAGAIHGLIWGRRFLGGTSRHQWDSTKGHEKAHKLRKRAQT